MWEATRQTAQHSVARGLRTSFTFKLPNKLPNRMRAHLAPSGLSFRVSCASTVNESAAAHSGGSAPVSRLPCRYLVQHTGGTLPMHDRMGVCLLIMPLCTLQVDRIVAWHSAPGQIGILDASTASSHHCQAACHGPRRAHSFSSACVTLTVPST